MTAHQPLHALKSLRDEHSIRIVLNVKHSIGALKGVDFYIGGAHWPILIDDEYNDLIETRQVMCLFLVLRELESYQTESDFLKWCMHKGSDPADFDLLQYYRSLGPAIIAIEKIIGSIDSQISSLDYELRTGIIQELYETL